MQAPEMVRVPLEELVLQIHLLGLGPAGQFLEKVLEPPPKASVEGALTHLQALGALTSDQQLTPLGLSAQPHHVCVNVFNKKHVAHVPGFINYILLYHAHTHQHTACQSVDQCSLKWLLNMSDSKSLSTIMCAERSNDSQGWRCAWQVAFPALLACFACCPVLGNRKKRENRRLARHIFTSHFGYRA